MLPSTLSPSLFHFPTAKDYIRAGDYAWASAMEKRWLSDGGAKPRRLAVAVRLLLGRHLSARGEEEVLVMLR